MCQTPCAAPAHLAIFKRAGNAQCSSSITASSRNTPPRSEIGVLWVPAKSSLRPAGPRRLVSVAGNHPRHHLQYQPGGHRNRQISRATTRRPTPCKSPCKAGNGADRHYRHPEAVGNTFGVMTTTATLPSTRACRSHRQTPTASRWPKRNIFPLTIRNDANATDTINPTIDNLTNLPGKTGSRCRIMAVSGIEQRKLGDGTILASANWRSVKPSNVSTLFDTNGDGIPTPAAGRADLYRRREGHNPPDAVNQILTRICRQRDKAWLNHHPGNLDTRSA